jgi:hypothetical protein
MATQVGGCAFTQHDLVAAGSLAAVAEPEHRARSRPVQRVWQRDLGEGVLDRQPPQVIRNDDRPAV